MLALHKWKLLGLSVIALLALLGSLASGELKPWGQINGLDVVGEGGLALLSCIWLLLILHSRPAGRVTQFLSLGLSAIFLAGFQDLLDEFIHFPDNTLWDHWIESGFMPIGLLLLTLGIYHWHKEQLLISQQLRKRERLFREHRGLDFITSLSGAHYLRAQLTRELTQQRSSSQVSSLALVLIDIDNFAQINRHYGNREGDNLLQALSELILLNIRPNDLLCRYAGDRFALLLPNTGARMAQTIGEEISQAVRHFAFKPQQQNPGRAPTQVASIFHSVSIGIALSESNTSPPENPDQLIARATQSLNQAKQQRSQQERAA